MALITLKFLIIPKTLFKITNYITKKSINKTKNSKSKLKILKVKLDLNNLKFKQNKM